jgi:glycosyltransferase involved in cell wall biosynthesis
VPSGARGAVIAKVNRLNTASVSVVIPTFNGSRFIRDTLQSVYAQTLSPSEIIVVDDCSTDGTPEVVESLASHAPISLQLIRLSKNSGGPGAPMNVGVENARSPVIALLDQDDLFARRKLERQLHLLLQFPDAPLVFGLQQTTDNGWKRAVRRRTRHVLALPHRRVGPGEYLIDRRALYREMVEGVNPATGASNLCFWKNTWRQVGGFSESLRIYWDCEFSAQACRLGDLAFVKRVVHYHRKHAVNLSSQKGLYMREQFTHLTQHMARPHTDSLVNCSRSEIANMYLGLGYWEAWEGRLLQSLRAYAHGLRYGAPFGRTIAGVLKTPWRVMRSLYGGSGALPSPKI